MNKIYLVGKIGKSVKFNENSWGSIGGDCEAPLLLKKIAELNPNDKFIIIGKNDLNKNKNKVPNNLISAWDEYDKNKHDYTYLVERLKNVKIDGCFLISGPAANCNIPQKSFKRNELKRGIKEFGNSLYVFQNYVAPIYHYLNETNVPWIMISNDPRYISQGNDLMNLPKLILSQYNEDILMQQFDNWEDQNYIKRKIKSIYAGVEKIFLLDYNKRGINEFDKNIKFFIVLNEGKNGVKSRYDELKRYVLNYIDDVEIYGDWCKEIKLNDNRFKGSMNYHDLQKTLDKVKYSFIISIKEGWATMKIWELISHGVIPFLHPNYDSQYNIDVPEFLRVKSPSELHKKIEYLENNPEAYKLVFEACQDLITEDDISGKKLNETILNNL